MAGLTTWRPSARAALITGLTLLVLGAAAPVAWFTWRQPERDVVNEKKPTRPAMVALPGGAFEMGSPEGEPGRDTDETQHRVQVRPFFIGRTEVTQAQWFAVMGGNPSYFKDEPPSDRPVERVTWGAAIQYLNKLSKSEGLPECYAVSDPKGDPNDRGSREYSDDGFVYGSVTFKPDCTGYRLPTEAEWEYAVRAQTVAGTYVGAVELMGENNAPGLDPIAWYGGNSRAVTGADCSNWPEKQDSDAERCATHPVGAKQANPWHLVDMLGNVWEWTHTGYAGYPFGPETTLDEPETAWGPRRRVARGCGWDSPAANCRAAYRFAYPPALRDLDLGFRPARSRP